MSGDLLKGEPVAADVRSGLTDRIQTLDERGVTPTLATVLMSDDPAATRFMDLKQSACAKAGVATRDVRLDPDSPAPTLYETVDGLSADPDVHGVFVQVPLPDQVSLHGVRTRIAPMKDVDCFHPETLGRLVTGDPAFIPATPGAVCALLEWYDVAVDGQDVVIVGRSDVIGKPLANLLVQDRYPGNATVTVCHSRTEDLGAMTNRADLIVTAAGVPGLVDGSMLSDGVTIVDVSASRREGSVENGTERTASTGLAPGDPTHSTEVVGDVEFESARRVAGAITPVPGGVGPVTLAMLVRNVVVAAEQNSTGVERR